MMTRASCGACSGTSTVPDSSGYLHPSQRRNGTGQTVELPKDNRTGEVKQFFERRFHHVVRMVHYAIGVTVLTILLMTKAYAMTPEEAAMKRWFDAMQSGDSEGVVAASCHDGRSASAFGSGIYKGMEISVGNLLDYSTVTYSLVGKSPDGRTAFVRFGGHVGVRQSWFTDEMALKPANKWIGQRSDSDIGLVLLEDGKWTYCGLLSINRASSLGF